MLPQRLCWNLPRNPEPVSPFFLRLKVSAVRRRAIVHPGQNEWKFRRHGPASESQGSLVRLLLRISKREMLLLPRCRVWDSSGYLLPGPGAHLQEQSFFPKESLGIGRQERGRISRSLRSGTCVQDRARIEGLIDGIPERRNERDRRPSN